MQTSDDDSPGGRVPGFVNSVERALAVIRAFSQSSPELTLSEVARATNLTRATARRFLLTLEDLGYVRTNGRLFGLRPRVLELGFAYLSSLTLPQVAQPHMEALVAATGESCSLSVLDGWDAVYVCRVPGERMIKLRINVGTRFPAYITSMGRLLLAYQPESWLDDYYRQVQIQPFTKRAVSNVKDLRAILDETRVMGYCIVDQELEEGLRSIALPVRDHNGAVVAAIDVSASLGRGPADKSRRELLPQLAKAKGLIEEDYAALTTMSR